MKCHSCEEEIAVTKMDVDETGDEDLRLEVSFRCPVCGAEHFTYVHGDELLTV